MNPQYLCTWWSMAIAIVLAITPRITLGDWIVEERSSAFIFPQHMWGQSHAPTIVETPDGLVAAWYAGPHEGHPNVEIYLSRNTGSGWSMPQRVAHGIANATTRYPTWNPVLFYTQPDELRLYYKVGPTPSTWWSEERVSHDGGLTWSDPITTTDLVKTPGVVYVGPDKNKPVRLADGTILSGSASETNGWKVHFARSEDDGQSWSVGPFINSTPQEPGVIQPTIFIHPDGRIQVLMRSHNAGQIMQTWSHDDGLTWSPITGTGLIHNNSGIDGLTLADGRLLLVHNPIASGRGRLVVSMSDDGIHWQEVYELENASGEFSYPAVIQDSQGLVHIVYTYRRETIKHVVLAVPEPTTATLLLVGMAATLRRPKHVRNANNRENE